MKRSLKWVGFFGGLAAAGAFLTGRSFADGIPATAALSYSGRLETPNGDAVTGTYNLEVKFWDTASGGASPLCTTNSQSTTLEQGRFTLALPDGCTDAIQTHPDVWVEVLVDGGSLGRTKTGAVPYAVEASHAVTADTAGSADTATTAATATTAESAETATTAESAATAETANTLGTLTPNDVQRRVTGTCSTGQSIRNIASDGTVTCELDNVATYLAGTGLSLSGETFNVNTTVIQSRITGTCAAGSAIRSINSSGGVTCESDDAGITSVVAGDGIGVSTTSGAATVSVDAPALFNLGPSNPSDSVTNRHVCMLATVGANSNCFAALAGDTWTLTWINGANCSYVCF